MSKSTGILVAILLLIASVSTLRAARFQRAAEVAEANAAAALDTTRVHLRDSVAASTRLATQARIDADSLSGALSEALQDRLATLATLQRTRIAFDSVVALGQTATTDTVFVTPDGDSTRVATFDLEGPPISGRQTVRVGPQILLDSRLEVTPFSITYGVACADQRPVFVWETPSHIVSRFDEGAVSPDVCYKPPPRGLFEFEVGRSIWAAGGALIGLLVGRGL